MVKFTARAAMLGLTLAAGLAPLTAHALDAKQKEEIGAYIREYLVENPEVLIEVQQALEKKSAEARTAQAGKAVDSNKDAIFRAEDDIVLGNPDGDVTIVEFFDYNCGYCKHALADMDQIIAKDKNVRFVLKEFPILGPDSMAAHKVADAFKKIAPEKYADFHRALLGTEGRADEARAIAVATGLGVKEAELRTTMAEDPNDGDLAEVYRLATELGISGTPSYVVGNEAVYGAIGADMLETKVANVRSCGKTTC